MQAYKPDPNERMKIDRADIYRTHILRVGIDGYVKASDFLFHFQNIEYNDIMALAWDLRKNGYLHQIEDKDMYVFYKTSLKGLWLLKIKLEKGFDIPMDSRYY